MIHLLAKRPLPRVNVALVVAVVWAVLAVVSAVVDIAHLMQTW